MTPGLQLHVILSRLAIPLYKHIEFIDYRTSCTITFDDIFLVSFALLFAYLHDSFLKCPIVLNDDGHVVTPTRSVGRISPNKNINLIATMMLRLQMRLDLYVRCTARHLYPLVSDLSPHNSSISNENSATI